MARPSTKGTATPPPCPVPFPGWSVVAQRYRQLAAAHAPGGHSSLLLFGPGGVGKRAMARAWRHAARVGSDELPVVDLDEATARPTHPCVGLSTRPLPNWMAFVPLGGDPNCPDPAGDGK